MQEIWVSADFLAKRFNVNQRTIQRWGKDSKIERGKEPDQYDLVSADEWVIADLQAKLDASKGKTPDDIREALIVAQTRKFEAEAKLKELEYQRRINTLIEIEPAIAEIDDAFARVKTKLMALPDRLALQLAGLSAPEEIKLLLEGVVREALEELHTQLTTEGADESAD